MATHIEMTKEKVEYHDSTKSTHTRVHHKFGFGTGIDDQTEAPVRVPHFTTPQQNLIVVERVLLVLPGHLPDKFMQENIRRLARYFT